MALHVRTHLGEADLHDGEAPTEYLQLINGSHDIILCYGICFGPSSSLQGCSNTFSTCSLTSGPLTGLNSPQENLVTPVVVTVTV